MALRGTEPARGSDRMHPRPAPLHSRRGARRSPSKAALLALLLCGAAPGGDGAAPGYRTGPSAEDPMTVALRYLTDAQLARGARDRELASWALGDRYRSAHNGVTHLYLRQLLGGVEVRGAEVTVAVTPEGRLVALRPRFVSPLRARARPRAPTLEAVEAVERAAARLGLSPSEPFVAIERRAGPDRAVTLTPGGIFVEPISARLRYLDLPDGTLPLVWSFDLRPHDPRFWWEVAVDAQSGLLRRLRNRVRNDEYRVFALPLESPDQGARTLEVDPADPLASPFGWHDVDAAAGAEFTHSEGNNVFAASNAQQGASLLVAEGGPALVFDFPLDLGLTPDAYQLAAVSNLFYWNNVLHDLHARYGFDEAAGSFQQVHYGPDPSGAGDEVIAFAQDFNDENNASMATPPDGSEPIMRMHVFSVPVLELAELAGRHEAGEAEFGPELDTAGLTGAVVAALDPSDAAGPSVMDACSPLTNAAEVAGEIALVDRGSCNFIDKVDHAETAGAVGVIVANNVPGGVFTMSKPQGKAPKIDVPSIFVRQAAGALVRDALALGDPTTATLRMSVRDSDLDEGVVIHEYGHGVSTRLTGGPSNASCLLSGQAAGMGEGWSDFWTLALTVRPGDAGGDPRTIGEYLTGSPGIRNFAYSTDPSVNPQTFVDVTSTNQPHGVGEIWALALWELYWILVNDLGFDADLYSGTGGNNAALQLVMDALKLQPCDPDFVDARDALLLADLVSHGQAHECRIWRAFARRGLGAGADADPDPITGLVSESFALPTACPLCADADADGLTDQSDVDLLRAELASPGTLTPEEAAACAERSLSGSCSVLEVVLLRRGLAGLSPGLEGGCAATAAAVGG